MTRGLKISIGADTSGLSGDMKKAEAEIVAKARAAERAWQQTAAGMFDGIAKKAAEAGAQLDKSFDSPALARQAGRVDTLRASMDPLFASTPRYENIVEQVNRAVASGAVSQERANIVLKMAEAQYEAATQAARGLDVAQAGLGGRLNAMKPQIQGVSFQLGDMATQIAAGTSASTAAAMQLPQLLGNFGVLGAVLGTVAAVGIPVAAAFFSMGEEGEEAAEKVRTLEEALGDAQSAINTADEALARAAAGGAEDLQRVYGVVTEKVRGLALALAEINVETMRQEVAGALDGVFSSEGLTEQLQEAVGAFTAGIATATTDQVAADIAALRAELASEQAGLTLLDERSVQLARERIAEIEAEIALLQGRIADSGGLGAALTVDPAQFERLRELVVEIPRAMAEEFEDAAQANAVADMIAELRTLFDALGVDVDQGLVANMTKAEDVIRQAARVLTDAEAAASGLATASGSISFDGAVSSAAQLARQLGISLRLASRLMAMGGGTSEPVIYDPRDPRYDPVRAEMGRIQEEGYGNVSPFDPGRMEREAQEAERAIREANKGTSGGSGGSSGGGSSRPDRDPVADILANAEAEVTAMERRIEMLGKTSAEVAELETRHRLLDEAKKAGIDLDAQANASGQSLREVINQQAAAVGQLTAEMERAQDRQEQLGQVAGMISSQLGDAFMSAITGAESWGDAMRGAISSILADLARLIIQQTLANALARAFNIQGGPSLLPMPGIAGARASGGSVAGGRTYLVGENGPELFRAPTSGTIIPNHRIMRPDLLPSFAGAGRDRSSAPAAPTFNVPPANAEVIVATEGLERLPMRPGFQRLIIRLMERVGFQRG